MATIHGLLPVLPDTQLGQHAKDLIRRRIISHKDDPSFHHIIVPITQNERTILNLLDRGVSQDQMISWCGVMTRSPNATPSLHAGFGPNPKLKPGDFSGPKLKMFRAGPLTPGILKLIDNVSSRGMRIIDTDPIEHDSMMAITQGLTHLVLILAGDRTNPEIKNIISKWITPINTVRDMIFANPFAESIATEFFNQLMDDGDIFRTFATIVDHHLNSQKQIDFSTPNFERVLSIAHSGIATAIDTGAIDEVRNSLNSNGRSFLESEIHHIRSIHQS